MTDMTVPTVFDIRNLTVSFRTQSGLRHVVDKFNLSVKRGEQIAIVGESGSGKSVSMLAAMGLLPPTAVIEAERLDLNGSEMLGRSERQLAELRGTEMSMIFQNPMTSLNPTMQIGPQVSETVEVHDRSVSKERLNEIAVELLREVGVPNPELRVTQFPHVFSGGMRQRAVIAMALAGQPGVIVADEPTTALDVTVQAQIVDLIRNLQSSRDAASIVITHDLGLVAELAQRVVVMYAGRIVEDTDVATLFDAPAHPYAQALLRSRPASTHSVERLASIPGFPPSAADAVSGCPFHPRCDHADEICTRLRPELTQIDKGHSVSCHHWEKIAASFLAAPPPKAAEQSKPRETSTGEVILSIEGLRKAFGPGQSRERH